MASQVIPCRTDTPHYVMNVLLQSVIFQLQFDWNDRASRWYLQVNDATGAVICGGWPLLVGRAFMGSVVTNLARPNGDFVPIDTTKKDIEAGLTDLGGRVQLYYVPSTDLSYAQAFHNTANP
jgi:Domain of unknown function (DUF6983)